MSSMSTSSSSPNSNVHSPSSSPNASVSLILAFSGSSPYALTNSHRDAEISPMCEEIGGRSGYVRLRASSAVYFTITSALSSWKSRSERRMISPWLIQT